MADLFGHEAPDLLEVEDLALLFRVKPDAIHKWAQQGMPVAQKALGGRGNRSQFLLRDVVAWYFAENSNRREVDRQRGHLMDNQSQLVALQVRKRSGELVEVAAIRSELARCIVLLRETLLAIPERITPILAAESDEAKVRAAIDGEIRQALEGFAAALRPTAQP